MPAAAAAIPTAISGVASIGQMISGNKAAKKTQEAIDNYKRQDLTNPYESLQVSTMGADRQREDLARSISTMANNSVMGGSRAILGLAPQMLAQQNQQEAQIMANLDEQEKQRQQMVARGNEMVQNMQENREQNDLMGLGNALNTARQERMNGVNGLMQTAMGVAKLGSEGAFNGVFGNKTTTPTITTPTITNDEVLTPIQNKSAGFISPQNMQNKRQFNKSKSFTDPYWAMNFFK